MWEFVYGTYHFRAVRQKEEGLFLAALWPFLGSARLIGLALDKASDSVAEIGRERARAERAETDDLRKHLREAEDLLAISEEGSVEATVAETAAASYADQIRARGEVVRRRGEVYRYGRVAPGSRL